MKKTDAVRLRRKGEKTRRAVKHAEDCLYSDGAIIPKYPCTCGGKGYTYFNVLDCRKARGGQ